MQECYYTANQSTSQEQTDDGSLFFLFFNSDSKRVYSAFSYVKHESELTVLDAKRVWIFKQ